MKQPEQPEVLPLGPWTGVDTVDDATAAVFQPGQESPAALRAAVNVDLDRGGWPRRRAGRTKRLALSDGHSLTSVGGRLLLVDAGVLVEVDPQTWTTRAITACPGDAAVSFGEAGGEIFWSNGTLTGRITADGLAAPWGLAPPRIAVQATTGGVLLPGRYLVAATAETLDWIESGAAETLVVEVRDQGAINVSLSQHDPAATMINLYVSDADAKVPFFVGVFAADEFPITLRQVGLTTDALDGLGLAPPPAGQRIAFYRGRALVAAGDVLYWSQPLAYHRFDIQVDLQLFDGRNTLLEPLDDGFYFGTPTATYWIAGEDPETWQPILVDRRAVAEGPALRMAGRALPALEFDGPVLVWASEDGFLAGLPGGQVMPLNPGKVAMDAPAQATLAYRESPGLRQILLGLRERGAASHLASSDRVSCSVIKAGAIE